MILFCCNDLVVRVIGVFQRALKKEQLFFITCIKMVLVTGI